jgi:hypothetical protein
VLSTLGLLLVVSAAPQEPARAPVPGAIYALAPLPDGEGVLTPGPQFTFREWEPERPRPQALTPLYWWLITLNVLDMRSTYKGLATGRAREANPLMRPFVESKPAFVGVKVGLTLTAIWATERTRKKHPKRAVVTMAVLDAALAAIVWNNYRVAAK